MLITENSKISPLFSRKRTYSLHLFYLMVRRSPVILFNIKNLFNKWTNDLPGSWIACSALMRNTLYSSLILCSLLPPHLLPSESFSLHHSLKSPGPSFLLTHPQKLPGLWPQWLAIGPWVPDSLMASVHHLCFILSSAPTVVPWTPYLQKWDPNSCKARRDLLLVPLPAYIMYLKKKKNFH